MNKLSKALYAFIQIVRKPYLLNHILNDEQVKKEEFRTTFPQPLRQIPLTRFIHPDENVTVEPYAFLGGSCLATDMALLQQLCKMNKVEDYLEIGTWRGESVANVAPYVKNCFTLNLPDEMMKSMGLDPDYINMHRYFSNGISNITHLFGHSQSFDFGKLNKKFDLIFIDGDHHTEAVRKDTITALALMKNENSILVWHDASIDPETPRFEVLLGIYSAIPKANHKHIYMVSNSLCAIYHPFEIENVIPRANQTPPHYFSLDISVKQK